MIVWKKKLLKSHMHMHTDGFVGYDAKRKIANREKAS